jgi:hypothetical protein
MAIDIGAVVHIPPDSTRRRVVRIQAGKVWCVREDRPRPAKPHGPFSFEDLLLVEPSTPEAKARWDWRNLM